MAAVVLHSLPREHLLLLPQLPPGPQVVWIGWGFDYCGLAADAFPEGLLGPQTAALLARLLPREPALQPGRMRASQLSLARPFPKPSHVEQQALARIDVFSPVLDNEHAMVARHQPTLRADYLRWNYGTVEEDLSLPGQPPGPVPLGPDLLVGNSATAANNHLEAFAALRARDDLDGRRLVVPLTYGDPDGSYLDAVQRAGRQAFGAAFVPLREHLPVAQYIALLQSCGHVLMNHVRQQALGNLVISGMLGARLHLRRENPIRPWMQARGLPVGDLGRLDLAPLGPSSGARPSGPARRRWSNGRSRRGRRAEKL
ncbi:TDP-N-acetylfucosamine:lipid II N-acetylfucosaminyltransferase [Piscinibacter sakaiensis]|uniref:TDP-N-acetylfucosamine:lipid II N-acetylfucosaminyltransferase n=1 Tax=Piscinibacter sakaiensis TaxID=1547922 RepID=UPI003727DC3D